MRSPGESSVLSCATAIDRPPFGPKTIRNAPAMGFRRGAANCYYSPGRAFIPPGDPASDLRYYAFHCRTRSSGLLFRLGKIMKTFAKLAAGLGLAAALFASPAPAL